MPQSKQIRCSAPDIALPVSGNNKSNIKGLKGYYYEEMIKRLNEADKGRVGSVGYFLRWIWKKHESNFVMHEADVYSEWHEQSQKANMSEFEKKHRRKEIGFRESESGIWGIYSDLLYDTYQKDWSKAYQLTFHCFFRNVDYLSNYIVGECFSCTYENFLYFAHKKKYQFGEVIINDVEKLLGDKAKLSSLHGLPKHDKAPLYDIIGKVLDSKGYSYAKSDREDFRHGQACWLYGDRSDPDDFPKYLSEDVFAHMASAAVVNPKAFEEMRKCLPDSYKMFIGILEIMMLKLCKCKVEMWEKRQSKSEDDDIYYNPLPLEDENSFMKTRIIKQAFSGKIKDDIENQKLLEEIRDNIEEDLHSGAGETYRKFRDIMIGMAQHHLHIAVGKDYTERYEFTYVFPQLYDKDYKTKELHQGYYNYKESIHTMGSKFGGLLRTNKHMLVIHLHPLKKDDRKKLLEVNKEYKYTTMFSDNDILNINDKKYSGVQGDPLWIGIEIFEGRNGTVYADAFISRGQWGMIGKYIPAKHMERIEGNELKPKFHGEFKIIKVEED